MQRSTHVTKVTCGVVVATALLTLPGCAPLDWLKKTFGPAAPSFDKSRTSGLEAKAGTPLLTIDGKAVITDQSLEAEFNEVLATQPMYQQIAEQHPGMAYKLKRDFYEGAKKKAAIIKYVYENKLDQRAEYQNELQQGMEQLKTALNIKAFVAQHPVTISEADIKQYYEENKDKPHGGILLSQGGVKAVGVYFDSEAAAQTFLNKVKAPGADFEAIAQQEKVAVKPFDVVHQATTGLPSVLKEKILGARRFPSSECVKVGDKSFCVVQYMGKEETKYRPYEQVRDLIEQQLKQEKLGEVVSTETEKLLIKYGAQENQDYWNKLQQEIAPTTMPMAPSMPETPEAPEVPATPVPEVPTAPQMG